MALFGFFITFVLFCVFYLLRNKPFFSKVPVIFSAGVCIMLILTVFQISYETYYSSARYLSYLIAPITVVFAYPLYQNSNILIKNKRALYPALVMGTLVAIASTYFCATLLHAKFIIVLSMLPKSTTMPIAIEISKSIGGYLELTACVVVMTGVLGALLGHFVLKRFKVTNDVAIGLAMGSASHVIGTAACAEKQRSRQVAAGTIALILVGFLSTILIPLIKYLVHLVK